MKGEPTVNMSKLANCTGESVLAGRWEVGRFWWRLLGARAGVHTGVCLEGQGWRRENRSWEEEALG